MFQKLRFQLLLILLIFGIINIIIIVISQIDASKKRQIEQIIEKTHILENLIYKQAQDINSFFTYETKQPHYFITQNSEYLNKINLINSNIQITLKDISLLKISKNIGVDTLLKNIKLHLDSTVIITDSISKLIYKRGYKDWGVEGEMRDHAHKLEKNRTVPIAELLMLRRHEKDYIIRNEQKYIDKFHNRIKILRTIIEKQPDSSIKKETLSDIDKYLTLFNKMVNLDRKIGLKNNTALKNRLENNINFLLNGADKINSNCIVYKQRAYKKLNIIYAVSIIIIIITALILSLKLSELITKRISILSKNISSFVLSNFTADTPIGVKQKNDEVGTLINNFEQLKQKITEQIEYLEIKVEERTEEINAQKDQILLQNKKITDSIRYAMRIQETLLPQKEEISKTFPEHFIIYKPKDIVSGDFYWYKRIQNSDFNIAIIAVADCTGHGIPGAFMSMLGIAFLNDITLKKNTYTTADILNKLRQRTIDNLSQQTESRSLKDGMDMALVIVDYNKKIIQFSGAYRNLTFISNGKTNIYKGDRMPIGKYINDYKSFSYISIPYRLGNSFYMFTDGFTDQHNINNKKYLRKKLNNLLLSVNEKPMHSQKVLLERELNIWKGTKEQTDDILLAGFRLTE